MTVKVNDIHVGIYTYFLNQIVFSRHSTQLIVQKNYTENEHLKRSSFLMMLMRVVVWFALNNVCIFLQKERLFFHVMYC